jgi:hypothetical protein
MLKDRFYLGVADVIRRHAGSEDLVDEVNSCVLDKIESLAAARLDELIDHSNLPYDSDHRGHTEQEAAQRWCPFVRETVPLGKSKVAAIGNRFLTD